MTIDATAQALVAETAAPIEDTEATLSEDDQLDAAYDRASAGEDVVDEPVAQEEPGQEDPVLEAVIEEVPSDISARIKGVWGKMEPEAREAVIAEQRELSRKLADQGRLMQGINPIRDVLVQAAKEMPNLANMRPEQVAAEVMELAKVSRDFSQRPVETLIGLIQKHNLGPQVAQALGGQAPQGDATLLNKISVLERQIQNMADPNNFQSHVESVMAQQQALLDVSNFAGKAEHWSEVEGYIPQIIPIVREKLGASASTADVLSQAYEVALSIYLPDAKAKAQDAVTSPPVADPKKAEAVLKAKSVNVTSRQTGQARQLTEDELLDDAWERAHRKRN